MRAHLIQGLGKAAVRIKATHAFAWASEVDIRNMDELHFEILRKGPAARFRRRPENGISRSAADLRPLLRALAEALSYRLRRQ